MSLGRNIASLVVMATFVLFATGTSKPKKNAEVDKGGDLPPAPTPTPTFTTPPAPAAPTDIDPVFVQILLGCDKKIANVGCRLLKEFDGADVWFDIPIADQVFYGESFAIGGIADGKKEFFFLTAGRGIGNFTGVGRSLLPDNAKQTLDAQKLLGATKAGLALPGSDAAAFMRTTPPPLGGRRAILRTTGRSQALQQFPTQTFIRKKGNRLIVVERTGSPLGHDSLKGPGTALTWVAELFPLK